ncbi:hypothetical protein CRUP_004651 [Coryphaenoides rupestris]|nr:hypothetical protein CRUP_004651 [Coryphaenoides rupestris]
MDGRTVFTFLKSLHPASSSVRRRGDSLVLLGDTEGSGVRGSVPALALRTAPRGYECHMSCAVRGDPAPHVTWYRNDVCLNTDTNYHVTSVSGVCTLLILNVGAKDTGEYKVVLDNPLGSAQCSMTLNVRGCSPQCHFLQSHKEQTMSVSPSGVHVGVPVAGGASRDVAQPGPFVAADLLPFEGDEIRRLKQDLQNKQELIMGLSSVATAQAKHLSTMNSSYCTGLSTECSTAAAHDKSTLPWSGSITTGGEPILALNDDIWPIVGTGSRSQTYSTPSNSDPWVQVNLSRAKRSPLRRLSETLLLSNTFQALDTGGGSRSQVGLQQSGYPSSAWPSPLAGGSSIAAESASPPAALASTAAAGCYRGPVPAQASAPEHDGRSTSAVDRTSPPPSLNGSDSVR